MKKKKGATSESIKQAQATLWDPLQDCVKKLAAKFETSAKPPAKAAVDTSQISWVNQSSEETKE